jgi:ABC-type amino acid transport substrate-binding protein
MTEEQHQDCMILDFRKDFDELIRRGEVEIDLLDEHINALIAQRNALDEAILALDSKRLDALIATRGVLDEAIAHHERKAQTFRR